MAPEKGYSEEVQKALEEDSVPEIYFNAFANTLSTSDVMITLARNGKPVAVLNASYTVVKSLAQQLQHIINYLEETTEQPIMTREKIEQDLQRISGRGSEDE